MILFQIKGFRVRIQRQRRKLIRVSRSVCFSKVQTCRKTYVKSCCEIHFNTAGASGQDIANINHLYLYHVLAVHRTVKNENWTLFLISRLAHLIAYLFDVLCVPRISLNSKGIIENNNIGIEKAKTSRV